MAGPPPARRPRRALVITAALAATVFGVLAAVVWYHPEPVRIDRVAARVAVDLRDAPLTAVMSAFSFLGSSPAIALQIVAIGGLVLLVRRDPRPGLWLLAAFAGAWFLSNGFKAILDRPRPDAGLVGSTGAAFPSGHATQGAAYFVMLGLVLAAVLPRPWRGPASVAAVSLGVLSGLSRIYLGVHWLTDVAGGFALGLMWLAVLVAVARGPSRAEALPL